MASGFKLTVQMDNYNNNSPEALSSTSQPHQQQNLHLLDAGQLNITSVIPGHLSYPHQPSWQLPPPYQEVPHSPPSDDPPPYQELPQQTTPIDQNEQRVLQETAALRTIKNNARLDSEETRIPPTNMDWALCAFFCCVCPFGIIALIYANQVTSYISSGDYENARKASNKTKGWSKAGIITALAISMISVLLLILHRYMRVI
ncbi:uncharacterized protein [Amphiura filiformis]|uniref:uncharacterized protein n=1 Tax=Amphiura filiformis TaxID=82378 RepID=UPI003B21294D